MLWFAHFGMNFFVEVLNYWEISIHWITQAFNAFCNWMWLVKGLSWGIKHDTLFCIPYFNGYNLRSRRIFQAQFLYLILTHLLCFKILQINPILTSINLVHENIIIDIMWIALRITVRKLGKLGVKVPWNKQLNYPTIPNMDTMLLNNHAR